MSRSAKQIPQQQSGQIRPPEAAPQPEHQAGAEAELVDLQARAGNRAVHGLLGGGQPLPPELRVEMEARFGRDFGQVRLHTGPQAVQAAQTLAADAYTLGRDIVFGQGRFLPDTSAGKRLLAHELAHVVQQSCPGGQPGGEQAEREAQSGADRAAAGQAAPVQAAVGLGVQRQAAAPDQRWKSLLQLNAVLKEEYRPVAAAYGDMNPGMGSKSFDDLVAEAQVRPSSAAGGQPRGPLTMAELLKIMPNLAAKAQADPQLAQRYLGYLNEAFQIFGIDTLESQTLFLAHAKIESKQLSKLTEAQHGTFLGAPPGLDDISTYDLGQLYPKGTDRRKTIDPNEEGKWPFIGRGPVQVTHKQEYLKTLAVVQRRADDLRAEALQEALSQITMTDPAQRARSEQVARQKIAQSARLTQLVSAVMRDPTQASRPEFAFLFSAAFAKKPWDDKGVAPTSMFDRDALRPNFVELPDPDKPGKNRTELKSAWMTGSHRDPRGHDKFKAHQEIKKVLEKK